MAVTSDLWIFLTIVALASWFQAVTGFGLGLIVIALGTTLAVSGVPELAAVISLLALVNVVTSLGGHWRSVYRAMWLPVTAGQVLGIPVGVWLLLVLAEDYTRLVEILLGLFVLAGSASMIWSARPGARLASTPEFAVAGFAGGVVGGMFAASAPVLGYVGYRQPLPAEAIRATLLACFGVTTLVRTTVIGAGGGLTEEVLQRAALAIPLVVVVSFLGTRYRPPLDEISLRRFAFLALSLSGIWLIGNGLLRS